MAIGHAGLGQVAFRGGDFENAIAEYDRAIDLAPTDPNGHVGRGDALVALRRLGRQRGGAFVLRSSG